MIIAPIAPQTLTTETIPLRREYLQQASLFGEKTYPLPKVLPGSYAVIMDADEWEDNFKRGRVIRFDYSTALHTILIDSIEVSDFYGREIVKAH
jgi:hypothetical protein